MEITFDKYLKSSPGYHWLEFNNNPFKMGIFLKGRYQKVFNLLSEKFRNIHGLRILDAGCGDGCLTSILAKHEALSYGIDLDKDAIEFAKMKFKALRLQAEFKTASVYQSGYEDEFFDAIVSSDVIEHLQEPITFLLELTRILKKDGIAIISTPVRISEHIEDYNHVQEWFPDEFKELIRGVFPISEFRYSHPIFWYELYRHSLKLQFPLNLMSYLHNPFLEEKFWKYYCLQYALIKKV